MISSAGGPIVETAGLGKRFGRRWALSDCTLQVPEGSVTALVGPNGAGKTTLLRILVGLASPTAGEATVGGLAPAASTDFLAKVAFLAQEAPLYRRLTVADHLAIGAAMNPRWDHAALTERLAGLRIPLEQRVGTLSGGQRSQVALGLALAKRPDLLVLDEPVAALDPVARREFLATLGDAVAGGGLSVIMSSHLVADLERACDHLILLTGGQPRLCGPIDDLIESHKLLVGPRRSTSTAPPDVEVISAVQTERESRWLARLHGPVLDPSWDVRNVTLEDILLGYMDDVAVGSTHGLRPVGSPS